MAWGTPNRERRVLKAGHSSIAVTLPKPWAEAMNLRPGDLVVFDQNDDGALYLKPAPVPGVSTAGAPFLVQARAFDTPGVLERLIVGAYRVGHDAIEVRADLPLAPDRVEEVLGAARGLLGVSVVAQESNRMVLQNFIDPSKYGLPQLVQRMKMILIAFLEEMESAVQKPGRGRRLATLEEEGNKVLALLVRQLFLASRDWALARRIGSPDPRQLLEWRVAVYALEELSQLFAEALGAIYGEGSKLPTDVREALATYLPEMKGHLKAVVEALMHPSLDHACDVYHQSAGFGESVAGIAASGRRNGLSATARSTLRWLPQGAGCLALLAELAIDRAVAAGSETVLIEAA
jgi:AbrB family looped-hinge helix DNA binding protein